MVDQQPARMLRDRRPSLLEKIEVTTTSRGRNRNVKVAIDHLNVVAVIHRAADGSEQRVELADVTAVVERIKAAQKQNKRPKATHNRSDATPPVLKDGMTSPETSGTRGRVA
jgi:hypothetical protein